MIAENKKLNEFVKKLAYEKQEMKQQMEKMSLQIEKNLEACNLKFIQERV